MEDGRDWIPDCVGTSSTAAGWEGIGPRAESIGRERSDLGRRARGNWGEVPAEARRRRGGGFLLELVLEGMGGSGWGIEYEYRPAG
jgi:hypothetical protein